MHVACRSMKEKQGPKIRQNMSRAAALTACGTDGITPYVQGGMYHRRCSTDLYLSILPVILYSEYFRRARFDRSRFSEMAYSQKAWTSRSPFTALNAARYARKPYAPAVPIYRTCRSTKSPLNAIIDLDPIVASEPSQARLSCLLPLSGFD
jgi:hypothetical protein